MIVTFDFGIFPTALFVASKMDFETLKDSFAFDTEDNGYMELSQKRFDSWGHSNGVTASVLEKKTIRKGFLVVMAAEGSPIHEVANTAAHEAAHVIDMLYKFIGVQDSIDTEINAYLIGWVTKCIMSVVTTVTEKQ